MQNIRKKKQKPWKCKKISVEGFEPVTTGLKVKHTTDCAKCPWCKSSKSTSLCLRFPSVSAKESEYAKEPRERKGKIGMPQMKMVQYKVWSIPEGGSKIKKNK